MKLKVLAILLSVTALSGKDAAAQQWAFELWHDGKIVLLSGDTLRGLVKYDLAQDMVQFDDRGARNEVFTARKVLYFEIFDVTVNRYRKFFALPYTANTTNYKAPVFFELLEEGELTLLGREALESRTYSSPYYYGASYTQLVLVDYFFFLDEDGDINLFAGKRNDLLDMMGRKAEDVEKYIKANRLKYDQKYDLARIVSYYNSLVGGS